VRYEVQLPEVTADANEVFVAEWLVSVGDAVDVGDELVEVITDKANMVVEAEVAGTVIELKVNEESRVEYGQTLMVLEVADSDPA
jgi:pyruvate/2-oxoglutarate dehydrogenase complex dihydrolipoamide acyltransferase (E2) component